MPACGRLGLREPSDFVVPEGVEHREGELIAASLRSGGTIQFVPQRVGVAAGAGPQNHNTPLHAARCVVRSRSQAQSSFSVASVHNASNTIAMPVTTAAHRASACVLNPSAHGDTINHSPRQPEHRLGPLFPGTRKQHRAECAVSARKGEIRRGCLAHELQRAITRACLRAGRHRHRAGDALAAGLGAGDHSGTHGGRRCGPGRDQNHRRDLAADAGQGRSMARRRHCEARMNSGS